MGVRKNQNTLTVGEWSGFVDAVIELKRRGQYDDFVRIHCETMISDYSGGRRVGHGAPSFLPWHRLYLIKFECALQTIDPRVTIPYWDWTVDNSSNSSVWSPARLGGNGRASDGQVTTGPFAYGTGDWTLGVRLDDRPYLTRNMGVTAKSLPTPVQLRTVLRRGTYDVAPWNTTSVTGFRDGLEGFVAPWLHNAVHDWVGGHMLTAVSPNDPAFWLHHSFVDKCWADWCAIHPDASYLPAGGTPNVIDIDDPLPPWNDATPGDVLDYTRYYTYA